MGLLGEVAKLLEDAQRRLPVLLGLRSARPHLHEVQYRVRLGLRFQLMGRLCFGEASLRPSAGIRVATLVDPEPRVAGLQTGTSGARLGTCRAAKSTQAQTRAAQCVAVVAATLLYPGLLEGQMSLP